MNKVRFPVPGHVGERVRAHVVLADVVAKGTGTLVTLDLTMEIKGSDKPGCLCQFLVLLLGEPTA